VAKHNRLAKYGYLFMLMAIVAAITAAGYGFVQQQNQMVIEEARKGLPRCRTVMPPMTTAKPAARNSPEKLLARGKSGQVVSQSGQEDDDCPCQKAIELQVDIAEIDDGEQQGGADGDAPRRGVDSV
jgi:hypothetical protein